LVELQVREGIYHGSQVAVKIVTISLVGFRSAYRESEEDMSTGLAGEMTERISSFYEDDHGIDEGDADDEDAQALAEAQQEAKVLRRLVGRRVGGCKQLHFEHHIRVTLHTTPRILG
jgi:hypothetical protein